MIESISMGKLLFKGKVSRSDTIVYSDHMNTKWWVESRTTIEPEDLKDKGIEVYVEKSEQAAELFNELTPKKKTIGLFHLL